MRSRIRTQALLAEFILRHWPQIQANAIAEELEPKPRANRKYLEFRKLDPLRRFGGASEPSPRGPCRRDEIPVLASLGSG